MTPSKEAIFSLSESALTQHYLEKLGATNWKYQGLKNLCFCFTGNVFSPPKYLGHFVEPIEWFTLP